MSEGKYYVKATRKYNKTWKGTTAEWSKREKFND
jgi:hypothetical protein